MKLSFVATLLQAASFTLTAAYPIKADDVRCRSGPGTSYSIKKTYAKGKDVKVTCQTTGESIKGNKIWDKTSDGCYIADYYVKTGKDGFVTSKCEASSPKPPAKLPGPITNDYPYKGKCNEGNSIDPWNYYRCECVSFVAWRINKRLGLKFHNKYKGHAWGYANQWDEAAKQSGVTVNKTPKVGSIAQTNAGKFGHVAWVTAVGKDTVDIEEYNWNTRHGYGKRTVAKSKFQYIHLEPKK